MNGPFTRQKSAYAICLAAFVVAMQANTSLAASTGAADVPDQFKYAWGIIFGSGLVTELKTLDQINSLSPDDKYNYLLNYKTTVDATMKSYAKYLKYDKKDFANIDALAVGAAAAYTVNVLGARQAAYYLGNNGLETAYEKLDKPHSWEGITVTDAKGNKIGGKEVVNFKFILSVAESFKTSKTAANLMSEVKPFVSDFKSNYDQLTKVLDDYGRWSVVYSTNQCASTANPNCGYIKTNYTQSLSAMNNLAPQTPNFTSNDFSLNNYATNSLAYINAFLRNPYYFTYKPQTTATTLFASNGKDLNYIRSEVPIYLALRGQDSAFVTHLPPLARSAVRTVSTSSVGSGRIVKTSGAGPIKIGAAAQSTSRVPISKIVHR